MADILITEYQKKIFDKRYSQVKADDFKETYEDMVDRILGGLGLDTTKEEEKNLYQAYRDIFLSKEFIGGGRILSNFGGTGNNMVGNCFTVPIEDSRAGIMKAMADTFEIYAFGGGVGTNFSPLRPNGELVKKSGGLASGPISFVTSFDRLADTIKQGSSKRRAAKMTIVNCDHPDIFEFISAKLDLKSWNNTNISVGIFDAFLTAVDRDGNWDLVWGGKVYKTIRARDLWNRICECAWKSGEPGVIFLDTVNRKYPLNYKYSISATNPCQPADATIWDGDRYRIISDCKNARTWTSWETGVREVIKVTLNTGESFRCTPEHRVVLDDFSDCVAEEILFKALVNPAMWYECNFDTSQGNPFPWLHTPRFVTSIESLGEMEVWDYKMNLAPHYNLCQGVILANCGEQPLPDYGMCLLGSMVLPTFVKVDGSGEKYFDFEHFHNSVKVATQFLDSLIDKSFYPIPEVREMILKTRPIGLGVVGLADALFLLGIPYGDNKECLKFCERVAEQLYFSAEGKSEELAEIYGAFPDYDSEKAGFGPRRNSTLISFAPTGTISGLLGVSYGIEPHFAPSFTRVEELGTDALMTTVVKDYISEKGEIPEYARFVGGCEEKYKVTVDDHLEVLRIMAKWSDSAVSKTVNLPKDSTVEDVEKVFWYCASHDIKGCTVYRDGCRDDQPVTYETPVIEEPTFTFDSLDDYIELVEVSTAAKERPKSLEGETIKIKPNPNDASLYITMNDYEDSLFEVFFKTSDATQQELLDMCSRAITGLLRRGIDIKFLIEDFKKYESPSGGGWYHSGKTHKRIKSISDAVGTVLEEHCRKLEAGGDIDSFVDVENLKNDSDFEKLTTEQMNEIECPECGYYTYFLSGGCRSCTSCGYSKCG